MKTKILKINPNKIDKEKIKEVSKVLRRGGLVAFPTETVYGLGADALNEKAVKKIFSAKGRPQDNPLIVHVSDMEEVKSLVKEIPKNAELLMDIFWPGPLTIILKKSRKVPDCVSAGLDSVAIRMPSNKIALELIKQARTPIAAPSANSSGKPSPTLAEHVIKDLNGKIDAIIDGGEVEVGLESSVIDLTANPPRLLRPGKISLEELKKVLGNVEMFQSGQKITELKSPGMKYKHYSPEAKVISFENNFIGKFKVKRKLKKYLKEKKRVAVLSSDKSFKNFVKDYVYFGDSLEEKGKNLFKIFREMDDKKVEVIFVEEVEEKGLGTAIMNRLRKASEKI
jgi:L-threonylcarbamoyladenylate synthase